MKKKVKICRLNFYAPIYTPEKKISKKKYEKNERKTFYKKMNDNFFVEIIREKTRKKYLS